ncbi:MAG: hypothetical protein LBN27_11680 [Prevotellaceae bacterium]|jgi:uncharacterized protein (TIGR02145 family)|nr:hypothetical protein [Prevotellaceae bacterium]
MKKIFLSIGLLLTVSAATVVFNSCGDDKDEPKKETPTDPTDPTDPVTPIDSATTDAGVVINGIKWATRNVDEPGKFAATPESAGKFYQWNRRLAWAATGSVIGWSNTAAAGITWEKANDPSPAGWRVPTTEEQRTLFDTAKVTSEWTTQNGVSGCKFTDKTTNNSLFLPAAGGRVYNDGTLGLAGYGLYWSSTQYDSDLAYRLNFDSDSGSAGWDDYRKRGFSVRAVAE